MRFRIECDLRFRGVWKLMAVFGRRVIVRKTEQDMRRFQRLVESPPGGGATTPSHLPTRSAR
jgi:hypothetical protein